MSRSVKVTLEADVGKYIPPVIAAKDETEKLDDKIKDTNRDLDKTPAAAARAAAAMKLLGGEAGATRVKLEDVGTGPTNVLELLDKKLEETRANVKKFAQDFNQTGSIDSFNLWKSATKDLGDLERFKKQFGGVLADVEKIAEPSGDKSGRSFTDKFLGVFAKGSTGMLSGLAQLPWAGAIFKPISEAISAMPPEAQIAIGAAVAAAIVASSAFIGAAFSGALLGAVGTAGIGLAIVGQLHDPAVMGAFSQLKDQLVGTLGSGTSAFGPLLAQGAQILSDALLKAGPGLALALKPLQAVVPILAQGIGEFVVRLMPALQAGFRAAAPVLAQFARDLPGVADSLRMFFQALSFGDQGAVKGLHDLITLLDATLIAIGGLLGGLSKLYEVLRGIASFAAGGGLLDLAVALGFIPPAADKATGSTTKLEQANADLAKRMSDATTAADDLSAALDKLFNKNMSADQAAIAQKQSVQDLTDAIEKNGRQWDINTQAGRDNTTALENAIIAAEKKRVADVANGKDAVQAAQDYNQQVDALLGIAGKAGDAKTALDALKGKYEIDVQETYTTHFINEGTPPDQFRHGLAKGGIRAAQVGMIIPPSDPGTVLAGEPQTGGEVLTPLRGISQARAMALSRVVGNSYGFDVMPRGYRAGPMSSSGGTITVILHGGDDLTSAMLGRVRAEVSGYGGNVQVALGSTAGR